MDVIALAQFGIRQTVATLGTSLAPEQLERLFRVVPDVVLCFDGDRAGQAAAWRALEVAMGVLRDGYQLGFIFLPEDEDPDSFVRRQGPEAFQALLAKPEPLPEFFFRTISGGVDLSRMDGRAKLAELARPLVSKLAPGVLRTMMLNELATRVRTASSGIARDWQLAEPRVRPLARARGGAVPKVSALRLALALLVQNPEYADLSGSLEEFRASRQRELQLLCALVDDLRASPAASMAVLLERFGTHPEAGLLSALATLKHPALGQEGNAEFTGAMAQLRRQLSWHRANSLLAKQKQGSLAPEEDVELRALLQARTGPNH